MRLDGGMETGSWKGNKKRCGRSEVLTASVKPLGGEDWFTQYQDYVTTEWDVGSWCQWPGLPMEQHYKIAMSLHCCKIDIHLDMTLNVARI